MILVTNYVTFLVIAMVYNTSSILSNASFKFALGQPKFILMNSFLPKSAPSENFIFVLSKKNLYGYSMPVSRASIQAR
jgi:hypothetical protein